MFFEAIRRATFDIFLVGFAILRSAGSSAKTVKQKPFIDIEAGNYDGKDSLLASVWRMRRGQHVLFQHRVSQPGRSFQLSRY